MKTIKLLALLTVFVLILSACQKTSLRNDFFEYVVFTDEMDDMTYSNGRQMNGLMLGILKPFDAQKEELLRMTAEWIEVWRTFETENERVRELHEIELQKWLLYYTAFEKLDEEMLVANHRTWDELTAQDMDVYRQDLINASAKIDSLIDGGISALEVEHGEKFGAIADETNFFESRKWRKHWGDAPVLG
jgi:hypothetical protein